ncbi:hypothetical protein JHK85_009932 [Glycine max]|nr:hypothetical protein JHK85_009932 [Glycine max]KAG5065947.1 hypothetical protein JHK86_009678 [Glycine max]
MADDTTQCLLKYILFTRVYEGCCLWCQNCDRSFHGVTVSSLPPLVPGQEAYYCCWGLFPVGFVVGSFDSLLEKEVAPAPPPLPQQASSFSNWMLVSAENGIGIVTPVATTRVTSSGAMMMNEVGSETGPKKWGRPGRMDIMRLKLEIPIAIADRLIYACETLMTQDYRYAK